MLGTFNGAFAGGRRGESVCGLNAAIDGGVSGELVNDGVGAFVGELTFVGQPPSSKTKLIINSCAKHTWDNA